MMQDLKPEHNLDPEVAFVAILHHDKLPVDRFGQHDALWIKCPKEKEVASLVKAYKKRYPGGGEIVLRHDFQVIEEKTKVNVLTTRPPHNFIALEAVRAQELETRKTAIITATLNRAPLTEVTNTSSLTRSKSLSTPKDNSGPIFKTYSPRIIRPVTSSPSMGQHVSAQSPTSLPQPDQIGWEDFLFERLEPHRQNVE